MAAFPSRVQLPIELVDIIINFSIPAACGNPNTSDRRESLAILQACSVVCRSWAACSQPLLFSEITLYAKDALVSHSQNLERIHDLHALVRVNPHLLHHVRHLNLQITKSCEKGLGESWMSKDPYFLDILKLLHSKKRLLSLRLHGTRSRVQWKIHMRRLTDPGTLKQFILPMITRLEILWIEVPQDFLHNHPNLKQLLLCEVSFFDLAPPSAERSRSRQVIDDAPSQALFPASFFSEINRPGQNSRTTQAHSSATRIQSLTYHALPWRICRTLFKDDNPYKLDLRSLRCIKTDSSARGNCELLSAFLAEKEQPPPIEELILLQRGEVYMGLWTQFFDLATAPHLRRLEIGLFLDRSTLQDPLQEVIKVLKTISDKHSLQDLKITAYLDIIESRSANIFSGGRSRLYRLQWTQLREQVLRLKSCLAPSTYLTVHLDMAYVAKEKKIKIREREFLDGIKRDFRGFVVLPFLGGADDPSGEGECTSDRAIVEVTHRMVDRDHIRGSPAQW
ncbi:hypothetical protein D9613_001440 [Agrocybe pediades]|uniref:F-box domain-containing protein n=1 Tax=Agrocybe pediades TaxID=84607 RepID=A0A8H4VXB0_9AGAR|nr:hypothetical protein D9613_001440 [Agrocybe pediades]